MSPIVAKSSKNDPRSMKIHFWNVFGTKSRTGRLQDGRGRIFLEHLLIKIGLQGGISGSYRVPKCIQNRVCEHKLAPRPSKEVFDKKAMKKMQINENPMRKSMVLDGSKARFALYSSLITHIRNFPQNREINTKRKPNSLVVGLKKGPWDLQVH